VSSSSIREEKLKKRQTEIVTTFLGGIAKVSGGTLLGITMLASSVMAGGMVGLALGFRNLPDVRALRSYVPKQTNYIYDIKGRLLTSFHDEENRKLVKLHQMSPNLKRAVVAIEDSHFYQHSGFNPNSIGRALKVNLTSGGVIEGASTLTMQLVKNLYLSKERTFNRKLVELVLAIRIEQLFTKDEILEMYLNYIYWGHNSYGVETAAQSYFNKSASELNLSEAAMMAGIIQAPERFSPFINYKEAKRRQGLVLRRMQELGWITKAEETAAFQEPLKVAKPTAWTRSLLPSITEAAINELNDRLGPEVVKQGGLVVQMTIDYDFQRRVEQVVRKSHANLRAQGMSADQVAVAAVDPRTHFVKALIGSADPKKDQFNRAILASRQPGSSFKPFVYYLAFASRNYFPNTIIEDKEVVYQEVDGLYKPRNYDNTYGGKMSIYEALIQSRNIPAVKLGKSVGLDKVVELCHTLGFKSEILPFTSLPLGSVEVSPLEMANGFATFASNGWYSESTLIVRVTDTQGNLILDNTPRPKLVLDSWSAATLTSVLRGVIQSGTGTGANIGRPAAGKTGTTTSARDIWFVGYVPQLSAAVWVGNDNYQPIGNDVTGGKFAAPIWRAFMLEALKNEPVKQFANPSQFQRTQQ